MKNATGSQRPWKAPQLLRCEWVDYSTCTLSKPGYALLSRWVVLREVPCLEWYGSSLPPLYFRGNWQHKLFCHAQGEAGPANPIIARETILLPRAVGSRHFESRVVRKWLRVVFNPKVIFWPSLVSLYLLSGSSSTIFWLVSPEGWLCGRRLR